jgi:hypothetical protein
MKRITVSVCIALCLSLVSGSPAQSLQVFPSLGKQSVVSLAEPHSTLPTPKINTVFNTNVLSVSIGKVPKSAKVSYQWIRNGVSIPEEIGRTYEWKIPDCRQDIQVRVQVIEKGKKKVSKLSKKYNPAICTYTTGDLPAMNILHNCNIPSSSSLPSCSEFQMGNPGRFYGFVYKDGKAQPWFRVNFPEIDPTNVISWRASANGLFQSYTRSLFMIAKNEPSWACCDFRVTQPATIYTGMTLSPPDVIGLSSDRSAYVGFNFYDPFGLSESLVVDTIRVTIKFR